MNTEALVGANAYIDRDYPNLFLPDRLWQTVITREDVDVRYLQKYLASERCRNIISAKCGGTSGSMKNISKPQFLSLQIPLPPLDVQKEIVAEIEGYQKVINGARAVLDNYRPHIPIDPEWPMVELGEVCKPEYGFTEKAMESGNARFVRITDISESGFLKAEDQKFITLTEDAKNLYYQWETSLLLVQVLLLAKP
jgi:type I restriction enzyme M protein